MGWSEVCFSSSEQTFSVAATYAKPSLTGALCFGAFPAAEVSEQ